MIIIIDLYNCTYIPTLRERLAIDFLQNSFSFYAAFNVRINGAAGTKKNWCIPHYVQKVK